ncbi:MAG: hypothetical protein M3N08_04450, partial [Pseudomonadota bacterium]|nr:hypothetical protein [Pseudomonadota bacterium]
MTQNPLQTRDLWPQLVRQAEEAKAQEPALGRFIQVFTLDHKNLAAALAFMLGDSLAHAPMEGDRIQGIVTQCYNAD